MLAADLNLVFVNDLSVSLCLHFGLILTCDIFIFRAELIRQITAHGKHK